MGGQSDFVWLPTYDDSHWALSTCGEPNEIKTNTPPPEIFYRSFSCRVAVPREVQRPRKDKEGSPYYSTVFAWRPIRLRLPICTYDAPPWVAWVYV